MGEGGGLDFSEGWGDGSAGGLGGWYGSFWIGLSCYLCKSECGLKMAI